MAYDQMIDASRNVITGAPFDSSETPSTIWEDFQNKVESLEIPDAEKTTLLGEAKAALVTSVMPAYEKFIEELEDVHTLFKDFVSDNRPSVDMQKVATGEAWYGKRALDLNLVDELKTSDEYIIDKCTDSAVFLVKFVEHQNRMDKLMERFALASNRLSGTDFLHREQGPYTF